MWKYLFSPGRVLATPGATEALARVPLGSAQVLMHRHMTGDWGDLDEEDKATNNRNLKMLGRLLSAYTLEDGTKIWVITDAGHDVTTFLLPEEY